MKYSFEYYAQKRKRYKVDGIGEEIIDGVSLDVYRVSKAGIVGLTKILPREESTPP